MLKENITRGVALVRDVSGIEKIYNEKVTLHYTAVVNEDLFIISLYIGGKKSESMAVNFSVPLFKGSVHGENAGLKANIALGMQRSILPHGNMGYDWTWKGEWCINENGYWHCLSRTNVRVFFSYVIPAHRV